MSQFNLKEQNMAPKKKAEKKKGGAGDDADEYKGPNLYVEFATKEPHEIAQDMMQPKERLIKENNEFEFLVVALQSDIERLEADNKRLQRKEMLTDGVLDKQKNHCYDYKHIETEQRNAKTVEKSERAKELLAARANQTKVWKQQEDARNALEARRAAQRAELQKDIDTMQAQVQTIKDFMLVKDQVIAERDKQQKLLDEQIARQKNIEDAIETAKINEIEMFRKKMLLEIRAVKAKMIDQNENSLIGTTKLTVIQNAQLTGELEYQSKQTEHLMYKNHQMGLTIKTLTRDLEDHKQVEEELAKRSHFCQKVIKKYKQQIQETKEELQKRQKVEIGHTMAQKDEQDLLDYLNERIMQYESKLKLTQVHLKQQQEEYEQLLAKVQDMRTRYSRCALLLTEFIESYVQNDPEILNRQSDVYLDIDQIKDAGDIQNIEPESIVALSLVLLKQLQPYIQDLTILKEQDTYQHKFANVEDEQMTQDSMLVSDFKQPLQAKVTLVSKEDDQRLAFQRKAPAELEYANPYKFQSNITDQVPSKIATAHGEQMNSTQMASVAHQSRGTYQSQTRGGVQLKNNFVVDPFPMNQSVSPNRQMFTTAKTPYMNSRVRRGGGDGMIEKITAMRASQKEQGNSKLSLQYNNSSIPYLQRNRKKYNDFPEVQQAKLNPMLHTAGGAFQVKARLQNNLLQDYQAKMLPKLNF